jgi:hypothetical protein
MVNKEVKLTHLDSNQIVRYSFNEDLMANRVEIVGSDSITVNIDTKPLEEAIKNGFLKQDDKPQHLATMKPEIEYRELRVPEIIKEKELQIIQVPTVIHTKEFQIVEVPRIIEKEVIKLVEIEKVIVVPKVEIVEKTIIIEKIKSINYLMVLQTIAIIALVIKIIKG